MNTQAAILRTSAKFGRNDNETLRNSAICLDVLRNRVAEVCKSFLETTDAVARFDENIVVVEPGQIHGAESNQTSAGGTETGSTMDQTGDNFIF